MVFIELRTSSQASRNKFYNLLFGMRQFILGLQARFSGFFAIVKLGIAQTAWMVGT
jgi:hypothetical protein